MPRLDLAPPLGATVRGDSTTFAVYAGAAQRVDLCLFDEQGREQRVPLVDRVHGVWFGDVPGVGPGQHYGYRVYGAWLPERGHRHNPAKLLLDPYARAVAGEVSWRPEIFGHFVDEGIGGDTGVRDDRDSAPYVPRSVVIDSAFDWGGDQGADRQRRTPTSESVIYEVHPQGATALLPGVPDELRGTYAGLAHPAFVDHVRGLGVTTIELLPVHTFADEQHLATSGRRNYWGYNTLNFFAPMARYAAASDPQAVVEEFKSMVRALHEAGLEVILDVVYNHTAEQSAGGPTLCWRGLDNSAYYRLDGRGLDVDVTGCGNTVDLRDPMALLMVLDSLRYWVRECHIDGFRFDLAVALARGRSEDYDRDHPFLMALRTDPALSRVKLIAEPWDIGILGWRTGQFPPPFSEWNDRFRDTVRAFWLPDVATSTPGHGGGGHGVRDLATRLAGSQDLFGRDDRGPLASLNYVVSHDGFTLADLTAYHDKHNEANGEDNRDGHGDNRSWNHGAEGDTDDESILAARRRAMRNLLATTILATGVPMLCAGDEFGRSQSGNNNAYCQDNEISWLNWDHQPWQRELIDTTRFLIGLRAGYRVLRQSTFFTSYPRPGDGRGDLLWFDAQGEAMSAEQWHGQRNRVLQMLLLGGGLDGRERNDTDSLLLIFQGENASAELRLPAQGNPERVFELLWDSSWEHPRSGGERFAPGQPISLGPACLRVYRLA